MHLWKVPHAAPWRSSEVEEKWRGANILSDIRVPVLSVVCEPCGRRERYDVERLTRQYGWDAKLTDPLPALVADCPYADLWKAPYADPWLSTNNHAAPVGLCASLDGGGGSR